MATQAQTWARERNWNKFKLNGLIGIISALEHQRTITKHEKLHLCSMLSELKFLMADWKTQTPLSKEEYLGNNIC